LSRAGRPGSLSATGTCWRRSRDSSDHSLANRVWTPDELVLAQTSDSFRL